MNECTVLLVSASHITSQSTVKSTPYPSRDLGETWGLVDACRCEMTDGGVHFRVFRCHYSISDKQVQDSAYLICIFEVIYSTTIYCVCVRIVCIGTRNRRRKRSEGGWENGVACGTHFAQTKWDMQWERVFLPILEQVHSVWRL
jgi:hypothetical protein